MEKWKVRTFAVDEDDPSRRLEISFQVANATRVPLTLRGILTKLEGDKHDNLGQITLLAPGNPYIVEVGITEMTNEQLTFLDGNALTLALECTVLFADAFGKHWQQEFGRLILCGPTGSTVTDTRNTLRESEVLGAGPV
ncbi:MAG: hypothetical protein ACLQBK_24625 [Candidatus Sulfotelmatobacter sp.]